MDLNAGWSYTGKWDTEEGKEVSRFEVRKLIVKEVTGGIKMTTAADIEGTDKADG